MRTKWGITGSSLALMLALSVPLCFADNGNGGSVAGQASELHDQSAYADHQGHWGKHGGFLFHQLSLTDDQKKQLKTILHKEREDIQITFDQIRTAKDQLNQEIENATPDMNKVNALTTQLKTLMGQMVDHRVNSNFEVKKVLNPEQFSKYLEFQQKMGRHRFNQGGQGQERECCGHGQGRWGHWCFHHHGHHDGHGGYGEYRHHGSDDDND